MVCPFCRAQNDESAENCFTCGKGLFALTEGAVLALRYEVLSPLGKGGMGLVYKAHDRELDELIAVKVLRSDVAHSPDMARRFRSEIKLARKVRHRNVCGIHEYGQDGHLRFIVMELVEGVDLRTIVQQKGPLPPDEAYDLAIQVAKGLQAIHDVGIVHRDLKTPNIMLDGRGLVRVMDFGIAKSFIGDATTGATATGQIVGTPEYMSPEQARGQRVDFRSDLYALGVVIFELFTGDVPFRGDSPVATLLKHIEEPPPLDEPRAARIPGPALPLVRRALAKSPDERYVSARELGEALSDARTRSFPSHPTPGGVPLLTALRERVFDLYRGSPIDPVLPQPAATTETTPVPTPSRDPLPTAPPVAAPASGRPAETPTAATIEASGPAAETPMVLSPPRPASREDARPSVPAPSSAPRRAPPGALAPAGWPASVIARPPPGRAPARVVPWLVVGLAAIASVGAYLVLGEPSRQPPSPEAAGAGPPSASEPSPSPEAAKPVAQVLPSTLAAAAAPSEAPPSTTLRLATPDPTPTPRATPLPSPPALASSPPRTAAVSSEPDLLTVAAIPTPRAAPPQPTPEPSAARPTLPAAPAMGELRVVVIPWADVAVDGQPVGTSPLKPISLPTGVHTIVLTNPGYQPLQKRVTIEAGKTTALEVDLTFEGFPK